MTESNPEWALTKQEKDLQKKERDLNGIFERNLESFQAALTGHEESPIMSVAFFKRLVITAATQNPKLLQCSPASIYKAALEIAQLQLEPNTVLQEAFLIPYRRGSDTECQVQIGKNGWVKLAHRTGKIRSINALPVYQGEEFKWQPTQDPEVIHYPDMEIKPKTKIVAAYAWAELNDGSRMYEVLRKYEIDYRIKKFSGRSPAWKEHPDRMICRSVISRLIKSRLPVNEYLYEKETLNDEEYEGEVQIIEADDTSVPPASMTVSEASAELIRATKAAQRVKAKVIEMNGHRVDEATGEVLSQADAESGLDGAKSSEPARNKEESTTNAISISGFWKKISDLQKFWGCGPNRRGVLDMIKEEHGNSSTVKTIDNDQRQNILSKVESIMRAENEKKKEIENDDIPF